MLVRRGWSARIAGLAAPAIVMLLTGSVMAEVTPAPVSREPMGFLDVVTESLVGDVYSPGSGSPCRSGRSSRRAGTSLGRWAERWRRRGGSTPRLAECGRRRVLSPGHRDVRLSARRRERRQLDQRDHALHAVQPRAAGARPASAGRSSASRPFTRCGRSVSSAPASSCIRTAPPPSTSGPPPR